MPKVFIGGGDLVGTSLPAMYHNSWLPEVKAGVQHKPHCTTGLGAVSHPYHLGKVSHQCRELFVSHVPRHDLRATLISRPFWRKQPQAYANSLLPRLRAQIKHHCISVKFSYPSGRVCFSIHLTVVCFRQQVQGVQRIELWMVVSHCDLATGIHVNYQIVSTLQRLFTLLTQQGILHT